MFVIMPHKWFVIAFKESLTFFNSVVQLFIYKLGLWIHCVSGLLGVKAVMCLSRVGSAISQSIKNEQMCFTDS